MAEFWARHALMLVLLTPFCAGLLLLMMRGRSVSRQRFVALGATAVYLVLVVVMARSVLHGEIWVYRLGDWPTPWGIVLVADALTGWMLLVTALLAVPALMSALDGTDTQGQHFHTLFQMELFGLTGAFLTGDLFNLFVFFEVLLIASYGLAVHGPGAEKTRSGLHYVTLNLSGSALFLLAAGLIYAGLGSLNLADLARGVNSVPPDRLGIVRLGGILLLVVFGLKAAAAPLSLWLPGIYTHTSAPVAALFAVMTKVGIYAILRVNALIFPSTDAEFGDLFTPWLLISGLLTLCMGLLRALIAGRLSSLTAALIVASVGTLLLSLYLGPQGWPASLYYLAHSTWACALLFLLAGALGQLRGAVRDHLRPAPKLSSQALWAFFFFIAAIWAAGLPPSSGFLAKIWLLQSAHPQTWLWIPILGTALLGVMALAHAGKTLFLNTIAERRDEVPAPVSLRWTVTAMAWLVVIMGLHTLAAGPVSDLIQGSAEQLARPALYIQAVLGDRP